MSFEDAVLHAIADQFFNSFTDQNGTTNTYYTPSPALKLAQQLFESKEKIIMAMVMEKLDLTALAERVSKQVLEVLASNPPANSWGHDPHAPMRKEIRAAIIEKVASDMAKDLKEKMLAEEETTEK